MEDTLVSMIHRDNLESRKDSGMKFRLLMPFWLNL